jgi:hypothetical protein
VAGQRASFGQTSSAAAQTDVRQRYDSGQWYIPSYTLQCVGFDTALNDAMMAIDARLRCESEIKISHTLRKRQRTDTPSRCEPAEAEGSATSEGSFKKGRYDTEGGNDAVNACEAKKE